MEKDIYIKTEPGGTVSFGKLSLYDINLFEASKLKKSLSKDLLYKLKKGISPYHLVNGVCNDGDDDDIGNVGKIKIQDIFTLPKDNLNKYESGFYAIYISLSKVSIQFKIVNKSDDAFNPNLLIEKSIKINFPKCVDHQIYNLNFNIVDSYEYAGKIIKNANKNMIDRGYSESLLVIEVKNNIIKLVYKSENLKEDFFN